MEIINCDLKDINKIFELYDEATKYQKTVTNKHWQGFELKMVEDEIHEKKQWKILIDTNIACVFATTFSDPLIWKEKNEDPSVYIHRIATNPAYRGHSFVKIIIDWAKEFAKSNEKRYVRLDTAAGNEKLMQYYQNCGFTYLGDTKIENSEGLPEHYKNASFSLFEISLFL